MFAADKGGKGGSGKPSPAGSKPGPAGKPAAGGKSTPPPPKKK